jgi:hypothetical protein
MKGAADVVRRGRQFLEVISLKKVSGVPDS